MYEIFLQPAPAKSHSSGKTVIKQSVVWNHVGIFPSLCPHIFPQKLAPLPWAYISLRTYVSGTFVDKP